MGWKDVEKMPVWVYEAVPPAGSYVLYGWGDDKALPGSVTTKDYRKAKQEPFRLATTNSRDAYLLSATIPAMSAKQNDAWLGIIAAAASKGPIKVWTGVVYSGETMKLGGRDYPTKYFRVIESQGKRQAWMLDVEAAVPAAPNATMQSVERATCLKLK
jgi:hypothetical protein